MIFVAIAGLVLMFVTFIVVTDTITPNAAYKSAADNRAKRAIKRSGAVI